MHSAHFSSASSSRTAWKHAPTPVLVPSSVSLSPRTGVHPHNPPTQHGGSSTNPFVFKNTLDRPRGNPVASRTLLGTTKRSPVVSVDHHPSKRQKPSHSAVRTSPYFNTSTKKNGRPSSSTRAIPSSYDPDPEIQEIRGPVIVDQPTRRDTNMHDAAIMEIDDFSDDLDEPISRADDRSSPDPLLLTGKTPHPFETWPGQLHLASTEKKGKGREVDLSNQPVSASEEEPEEIESFASDVPYVPHFADSPHIPKGIVHRTIRKFENPASPSPRSSSRQSAPALFLANLKNDGSKISSRMKRKNEVSGLDESKNLIYRATG